MYGAILRMATGYFLYHCIHTPEGRQMVKNGCKAAMKYSGRLEQSLLKTGKHMIATTQEKPTEPEQKPETKEKVNAPRRKDVQRDT